MEGNDIINIQSDGCLKPICISFSLKYSQRKEQTVSGTILLGRGRQIINIPQEVWEAHLSQAPQHVDDRQGFMSESHQLVRYFVVKELPRIGKPLEPEYISQQLNMPLGQTISILDDLEKHLTFLYRNGAGSVSWAYPVTVDKTPHEITFRSGERLYGA
jgi:hypothetical protein